MSRSCHKNIKLVGFSIFINVVLHLIIQFQIVSAHVTKLFRFAKLMQLFPQTFSSSSVRKPQSSLLFFYSIRPPCRGSGLPIWALRLLNDSLDYGKTNGDVQGWVAKWKTYFMVVWSGFNISIDLSSGPIISIKRSYRYPETMTECADWLCNNAFSHIWYLLTFQFMHFNSGYFHFLCTAQMDCLYWSKNHVRTPSHWV